MAERTSGDGTGLSAIVNMALIVVTVAGFLTLVHQELTSDRPAPPAKDGNGGIGSQTVDVRLWEDPLRSSKRDEPKQLAQLVDEIKARKSSRDVRLLPVLVWGGPYSEDQENRIRNRYAVVSALGQSGYAPSDAEHVGSVVLEWPTTKGLRAWATHATTLQLQPNWEVVETDCDAKTNPCGTKLPIRYEWYRPRVLYPGSGASDQAEILVLWLDERSFEDEPLLRIALFLKPLIDAARESSRSEPVVQLIGPQTSSTLRAMLPSEFGESGPPSTSGNAANALAAPILGTIELYSPFASAMDEVLVKDVPPNAAPRAAVGEKLRNNHLKDIHFFNVDDARIADEILEELALRGVHLTEGDTRDHVILLSERDTFYGRMLSLTYGTALARRLDPHHSRAQFVEQYIKGGALPDTLHTFVYLRGLDGRTFREVDGGTPDRAKAADSTRARPDSLQEVLQWKPEANRAEGPSQFDYLARTGDQLVALQATLRRSEKGEIKAIGIVGSDVYDVLAILQALRARFPDVLFFTTGLDARLMDPKERDWARNLIVASSYGLGLHPDLQRDVPPFRDSSQTALFAATLAALDPSKVALLERVSPRRFEIGNTKAVDLSTQSSGSSPIQPLTRSEEYAQHRDYCWRRPFGLGAALLGLLGALTFYFLWSSFRLRAEHECGFLGASLPFSDPDIGGPEGAEDLIGALAKSEDPFGTWVHTQWCDRLEKTERSMTTPTEAPPDPSEKPERAAARHAAVEKKAAKRRADTLVALLNEMLHHTTRVEWIVLGGSTLADRALIDGAAPWTKPVPPWRAWARLRQRARTRAFLDDFLHRLSATLPGPPLAITVADDARRSARKLLTIRVQLVVLIAGVFVLALLVGWLAARAIWSDTFLRSDGEPFSVTAGTSAWPNLLLRIFSTALAIAFIVTLLEQLRDLFYRLTRRYRLPWRVDPSTAPPACVRASTLWRDYYDSGRSLKRLARAVVPTIIYFACARILLVLFGMPVQPWRGTTVTAWGEGVRYPFVFSFLLLSFLTIDAALRCRRFINALAALPTHYPSTTMAYFRSQRGDLGEEYLEEWIDIQLIADLTERVGRLLWFPGIVFFMMLASLNSWTDHWPMSKGLMLILVTNLGLSIASVVILQRAAQAARSNAESSLAAKLKRAEAVAAPSSEANDARQAEKLLEEIPHAASRGLRGLLAEPRPERGAGAVGRHGDDPALAVDVELSDASSARRRGQRAHGVGRHLDASEAWVAVASSSRTQATGETVRADSSSPTPRLRAEAEKASRGT